MAASPSEGPESVEFASVSERDESFFTEIFDYPEADIILRSSDSHPSLPFTPMSSPSEVEHILSPVSQDTLMATSPPPVIPGSTDRAASISVFTEIL